MHLTSFRVLSALLMAVLFVGCSSGGAQTEAPAGWEMADSRWWAEGVDTTQAFRQLDSLHTMGITDAAVAAGLETASADQFARAVKQELIALYRNNPEVVDSLFEEYVRPDLAEADLSVTDREALRQTLNQYKNEGYKDLRNHFTEPRRQSQQLSITYPDSLRRAETSGRVEMQLYLSEEGQPRAVKLLEGVHPVLNGIAMRAATQTSWQPAYITREGEQQPIPSWVRFPLNFQMSPGG